MRRCCGWGVMVSLGVEPPANRSPVFQAMFVLQNAPASPLELPGLSVTPVEVSRGSVTYELTLALTETSEGFPGVLEFNTDLFEPATAERLHADLMELLDGFPQQGSCPSYSSATGTSKV